MISLAQLCDIMPQAGNRANTYIDPLNEAMAEFGICNPRRASAFLAQIAHESGQLRYTRELADGSAYEGRADLGNTSPGDGPRYKGHGLIQITGRANHQACGEVLDLDLLAFPELLEQPQQAARSAGWFWKSRGLNELADTDKFWTISKRINGGTNGLDDRIAHWLTARKALGL